MNDLWMKDVSEFAGLKRDLLRKKLGVLLKIDALGFELDLI